MFSKPKGRPLKFANVEELQKKIEAYFAHCDSTIVKRIKNKNGDLVSEVTKPYTITGLAQFLGTNRQTLINYEEKDGDYFDTIKGAKAKIEACYEERALIGDNNPIVSIFTMKNNFGWKDKTEQEVQLNQPVPIIDVHALQDNHSDKESIPGPQDGQKGISVSGGNLSK